MAEETYCSFQQSTGCWNACRCHTHLQKHTLITQVLEQNTSSLSLNKEILHSLEVCCVAILGFGHNPLTGPITAPYRQALLCSRALGCMWASSNSALQSPYTTMTEWLPWHAQLLRRKELLHTDQSAMTLHGQLRNQKGALRRAQTTPRSLEPWWETLNHVAAQCGSLKQQDRRGRGSPVTACHSRGRLMCSSSKQPLAGCFGSLSSPCSPRQQGIELFCWRQEFSSYIPQWGQVAFINLFLRISLCFFPSFCFTFYLLKTEMSACQMSCVGRGSAGAGGSWCLMLLGGKAPVGAKGGSTTGHALMGLLMLKHDQNKQTK